MYDRVRSMLGVEKLHGGEGLIMAMTRLRRARDERGLKQAAVLRAITERAAVSGLSIANPSSLKALLSAWENGHRSVPGQYRPLFRAIYGMTDDELFGVDTDATAEFDELSIRIASSKAIDVAPSTCSHSRLTPSVSWTSRSVRLRYSTG